MPTVAPATLRGKTAPSHPAASPVEPETAYNRLQLRELPSKSNYQWNHIVVFV